MHCLATAYLEVSLDVRGYFQHVLGLNGFNLLPQQCQRKDGRLEGKGKKIVKQDQCCVKNKMHLSVFNQDRHGIVTFALEKEIRHRQALSWASSFSRLSVVFLLGQTQTCNQVRVFNNSRTHAIISFVHIAIIINRKGGSTLSLSVTSGQPISVQFHNQMAVVNTLSRTGQLKTLMSNMRTVKFCATLQLT